MNRRARRRRRARKRLAVASCVVAGVLAVGVAVAVAATSAPPRVATRARTTSTTTAVTTSVARHTILATPGWGVLTRTARGVAVDQRWFTVPGGAKVFVLRFRRGAVALHFHVGSEDPPGAAASVPSDAGPAISRSEWRIGVLGAFNGGFKEAAGAGGLAADGYAAPHLVRGMPTFVIDTQGQAALGAWGTDVPAKGHPVIEARQNLGYLVVGRKVASNAEDVADWGVTLHGATATARTAVGVNAGGDVLYAVGSPVLPVDLARGLVAAGALRAIELDINPYWPIGGAARAPLHAAGPFSVSIPYSQHDPSVYDGGWIRDYFVVLAEPARPACSIRSVPPRPGHVVAEPPAIVCGSAR